MVEVNAGRDALMQIDKALADRPERDGRTLKAAIQRLAAFRDHVVERHRGEGGTRWRPTLERLNAVVSVVMAAEFPIGEIPWDELSKARDWLDAILREEAASTGSA
ncbi:hypothetical protein D3273_12505 [Lichenibacterium minor]|uniref:Uncharacterized protein n=1 Tax=Lichenibacterium minor TaxID=2316528 RepID=A0A4Q2U5J8_9HYPH|nr:hypothetical protein [Lichenibacterium minor]RYC31692.1 hypothetical protein D3273_12505 [Lichenibacterium minor]